MNLNEIKLPEGLEKQVFEGLTEAEKSVIVTAAQCQSLVALVDSFAQRAQMPQEMAEPLHAMAQEVGEKALFYTLNEARCITAEHFENLMGRATTFIESAKTTAEQLHNKENSNATE